MGNNVPGTMLLFCATDDCSGRAGFLMRASESRMDIDSQRWFRETPVCAALQKCTGVGGAGMRCAGRVYA